MLARHLLAILVLPFTVVFLVPRWLIDTYGAATEWANLTYSIIGGIVGAAFLLAGFVLFVWCLYLFAARGKGTLAPWDPPRRLVVTGPYRYMRNPMITGVLVIVAGQAFVHGSLTLAVWFGGFLLLNQFYFMVMEEPMLENRFGEDYRRYKSTVHRWLPRFTPWDQ